MSCPNYKIIFNDETNYVAQDISEEPVVRVIPVKGEQGETGPKGEDGKNFEPTIVSELPATGDESKLYLTPKAHTTSTATGNPITASVAEDAGAIESFQLDGDTFQQTYTGKNLLQITRTGAQTKNGVTITFDGSSFILDGTATASADTDLYIHGASWSDTSKFVDLPAGTYTLSVRKADMSLRANFGAKMYNNAPGAGRRIFDFDANTSGVATITLDADSGFTNFYISIRPGVTFNNERFYVQLEKGASATDFEKFVGGTASPNPDYPQQIQTVTGAQTVSVIGKNLFNKNAVTNGGYIDTNGEVVAWETFGYSEYIRVIGGQTYSYSGTANNVSYSAKAAWYDSNKNFISSFSFGQSGQVTAPVTAKFLRTSVRIASPSGVDTYQLELGSTITTYEAYRATNYPISLGDIELCKLGTYQDYIWKDGEDWKIHKVTVKAKLTAQNWITGSFETQKRIYLSDLLVFGTTVARPGDNVYKAPLVSDHFTNVAVWDILQGTIDGIGISSSGYVSIRDSSKATSADLLSVLANNDIEAIAGLTSSYETDTVITDQTLIAQLETICTASLQNGVNTITNIAADSNLAGDIEISYYGFNPRNRYDKWLWLDVNNEYEQLNNPDTTSSLSSTRNLNLTNIQSDLNEINNDEEQENEVLDDTEEEER